MTRIPDTVLDAMLATLRSSVEVHRDEGKKLFALIDGALFRNMPSHSQRRWPVAAARSLLPPGTADTAVAVGPLLFELPMDQLDRALVERLINMTTGEMAGSFLVGAGQVTDIVENLTRFVDVRLDDGTEMVMRFYDPRILPFWLESLPDAYRGHLGAAVSQWLYWGPDFGIRVAELAPVLQSGSPPHKAKFPVYLSSEQEAQLLDSSSPYLMMGRLRSEDPGDLAKIPHTDRYGFFRQQMDRAAEHGLSGLNDVEAYCGLAVTLGSRFDTDPAMKMALQEVKAGTAFDEALATLNAADWKRIREAAR